MLSVLMVDADAPTGGDGLSWATAYNDLQDSLSQAATLNADADPANDVDSIWIAEGTYKPSAKLEPGDPRSASFSLVDGVTFYGGFSGTETTLEQRDWSARIVTLCGEFGTPNSQFDNAYTVVYCGEDIEAGVDGVSIIGGNANGSLSGYNLERSYGGGLFNAGTLTVTNCQLMGNAASNGGAIDNHFGTLTVTNCTLLDNTASQGGGAGIKDYSGTVTVTNCTILGNSAKYTGGGIRTDLGSLTVTDSTFSDNSADVGGGIYNGLGTVTVTNCMFSDNFASDSGGAIDNESSVLTIMKSSFLGNSAGDSGGGIQNNSGILEIANCTISGNSSRFSGGIQNDGGFYNKPTTLTITNSTISDNSAIIGGIYNLGTASVVTLNNTIVARNNGAVHPDIHHFSGTLSGSHNLIGDGSSQSALVDGVNSNRVGTSLALIDPLLSDVTQFDNGLWGYHLLPGSPALDTGDNSLAMDPTGQPLTVDIRGTTRVQNGTVDIGAVEGATEGGPAQTYTVTSLDETIASDGVLTILEAFEAANCNQTVGDAPAGSFTEQDVIAFAEGLSGTILVDEGELAVMGDLRIEGPAAELLTFQANGRNRVFLVWPSVSADLDGMTITGGKDETGGGIHNYGSLAITNSVLSDNSAEDLGGGIYSSGTLTASHCTFSGNSAVGLYGNGGGICNDSGTMTVACTTLSANSASNGAGGILNDSGTLILTESTLSDNSASYGGGIYNISGTLTVADSTLSGNSTSYGGGGGIRNSSGTLTVTNSTLSGNSTVDDGGGIHNKSGTVTVTNSTFSSNSASDYGGGIANTSGTLTVAGCTFSENSADDSGGGIFNAGTLTVGDSVFSGNLSSESGGGVYNSDTGIMSLTDSTFSGNSVSKHGGGFCSYSNTDYNTPAVVDCAFLDNSASYHGGAIFSYSGMLTVRDSILLVLLFQAIDVDLFVMVANGYVPCGDRSEL
ncbi:MAG: hypothetical protein JW818_20000, partial [Pirellulales bacterium]|nr:hypothetical protein [Pirellulales bacterium]